MRRKLHFLVSALALTAVATPLAARPADAAPPRGMFSATVTLDSATTFSTNGAVTFTRTSRGRYTLFAQNIGQLGNAQLSVWDVEGQLPICTVSSVTRFSTGTRVKVRCDNSDTATSSDAVFSLVYNSFQVTDPGLHFVSLMTLTSGSSTPSNQFRASGTGQVTVKRVATGRYRVRIPNESFPPNSGIVMTSALGSEPRWCNPSYWISNGSGGTDVYVECHRRGGSLANSRFSLLITSSSMLGRPEVPGGAAWSPQFSRTTSHTALGPSYSFNSAAQVNTHADQILVGSAEVKFPGVFPAEPGVIAKLVTAYGSNRCAHQGLHGLDGSTVTLAVACRTADNVPVKSAFAVMLQILTEP